LSLLRSIFSEFNHKISKFYSEKDLERGGIQRADMNGNKELISFISLSSGVMRIENEYYDNFHSLLADLIKLKPLTKNDKGICLAHQHHGQVECFLFEGDEFRADSQGE